MNLNRFAMTFLAVLLCSAAVCPAQQTKSERDALAQIRAQADKGDAEAQFKLAMMYANGVGVDQDLRKAARWQRKAAEQGLAAAQYHLALAYANGDGVKSDAAEALHWYRRAAEQGMIDAQVDLGRAYVNGRGVLPSAVEAVHWFRMAAEQGSAAGEYELARSYLEGAGVTKDLVEGLKWLRPAAEQGYALAEYRLGQCYEKGEGVQKDPVQAYKWYNLATAQDEQNVADIRLSLTKLETTMKPEQITEAQTLAREFKPSRPAPAGENVAPTTAPATGTVNVRANDDRGEIFVDGAFVGSSPALLKLTPGSHVVEIKRAGYKTYHREIQIGPGAELNLKAELEKEK